MQTTAENNTTTNFDIREVAKHTGIVLMTVAATLGMVELPEHPNSKVALSTQPSFVFATENVSAEHQSSQRREREESGPHYVSYSAAQRTPGRTGRI